MPRGTRLPLEEQSSASALSDDRFSVKKIAAQLSRSHCVVATYGIQTTTTSGMLKDVLVIWSDEKKFNLDGCIGQRSHWHDIRKEPMYFSRRNFYGGSLMIWGAFFGSRKVGLAFVSCHLDSTEYQEVLSSHLVPFLEEQGEQEYRFQQDNARIHVSRSTAAFLNEHSIPVLDWPPCSPDLNPIENLWNILAWKIYANSKQYRTINELRLAVVQAWDAIEPESWKTLPTACSVVCSS
ncbi:hypothetical protein OESDEN_13922 [Oesophagostomum dentatum]|uniref:Tc1-like transposase DDE domain-containing protein n=1 Tax=Oesophagostomum dentatum TaxID=61180 RepID=A0A0B1SS20_OESDE|nr:hypothetical protein OESDEN_13922 [Oesophagostomum dentatum]